ncbi:MAG TPA: 3-hydroxybutyrate dehydrogenase [Magnetospirillum sp.]|nr:3-hydroxybutyrate dehydrogenase [Magnetospirillum sp.]
MLNGRTAVVTGSTSGIGLGIAHALAAQGAHMVLNGLGDFAEIEALRVQLQADYGVKVRYDGADLSDPAACAALIQRAEAELGAVDILVNNAGIQHVSPVELFPPERWDAVIAVNLSSAFHTIRTALPGMKARGWGRVINVASAHGLVASANKSAYVASKHGLLGLTKVVALENAETPVTCNAVCPGWVLTPLVRRQIEARAASEGVSFDEARLELLGEKQPSRRFTTPEQIGDLAVFLCSPSADNMTGGSISIDGGWTAQ